ncbi:hypothetical protein GQ53DRAFT_138576 [Thozetella sp. PMI_491]|nr:hypothetical protein GQ53DRAFT_138576 [Thozetella sp. PMI_491]
MGSRDEEMCSPSAECQRAPFYAGLRFSGSYFFFGISRLWWYGPSRRLWMQVLLPDGSSTPPDISGRDIYKKYPILDCGVRPKPHESRQPRSPCCLPPPLLLWEQAPCLKMVLRGG